MAPVWTLCQSAYMAIALDLKRQSHAEQNEGCKARHDAGLHAMQPCREQKQEASN